MQCAVSFLVRSPAFASGHLQGFAKYQLNTLQVAGLCQKRCSRKSTPCLLCNPMTRLLLVILLGMALVFTAASCGPVATTKVEAQTPATYSCTVPAIFRGADDGLQSFAVDSVCAVGNAPSNGGFFTAEATYQLKNAFTVGSITTWLGTSQGSIEEAAGELAVEVPTSVAGQFQTRWIITNQKDKHTDVEGERIEHFPLTSPVLLPAGTRLHFFFTLGIIKPATNCPLGCGQQLNVYVNGP